MLAGSLPCRLFHPPKFASIPEDEILAIAP